MKEDTMKDPLYSLLVNDIIKGDYITDLANRLFGEYFPVLDSLKRWLYRYQFEDLVKKAYPK